MSVRLIVRRDNAGMAVNVGGAVLTEYRTYDIEHPELERYLTELDALSHAQVCGAETVLKDQAQ
jgi:hypothetical protein